jgi:putative ABC transport system substrate-binding protein
MKRRDLLRLVGSAAAAWPLAAMAQQSGRTLRLGMLLYNSPQIDPIAPLLKGLNSLGYIDGKNLLIEYRYAEGKFERLADLAVELAQLKPDVIFAYGGDVAPFAKKATTTIPVVVMVSNDPVQSGLVTSLAHPGGNITGLTQVYDDLAGKMLDYLKQAGPAISKVGVLWNPSHADPEYRETQRVAEILKVELVPLPVRAPEDFAGAFQSAIERRAEGMVVVSSRLLLAQRRRIAEFIANNRIPAVGSWGDWANDGLLLTYGPNIPEVMGRAAAYIDKIFKGAQAGDLPIERPNRFELIINTKAAAALGLKLPDTMLSSADRLIES